MLRTINSRLAIHGDNLRNSGAIKKQRPKAFLLLRYITLRPLLWTRYFDNEMQLHVQHDNLVLCLNLTRLRKCKLPGLRGGALLCAPGIFSLSNSFRPCFLCTPGPLSLRVYKTSENRSGLSGYRSNWSGPVLVWAGTKPAQIQNSNLNSKKWKIPKKFLKILQGATNLIVSNFLKNSFV